MSESEFSSLSTLTFKRKKKICLGHGIFGGRAGVWLSHVSLLSTVSSAPALGDSELRGAEASVLAVARSSSSVVAAAAFLSTSD